MRRYDIPEHEQYLYITDDLRIFRKSYRVIRYCNGKENGFWKPEKELTIENLQYKDRYPQVQYRINGVRYVLQVHRIVAKVFIPNPNNLPEVNHKDGNKNNYSIENLEWVSSEENHKHALENFLIASNMTKDDIIYIRANYIRRHSEFGVKALANKYHTSTVTIHEILSNTTFKTVGVETRYYKENPYNHHEIILNHLRKFKSISPIESQELYNIRVTLSSIIKKLQKLGYKISVEKETIPSIVCRKGKSYNRNTYSVRYKYKE